jgi:hypothetical protein
VCASGWFSSFLFRPGVIAAVVVSGRPVELFVPPEVTERSPVAPLSMPVLPQPGSASLLVGVAAIDHSGRLRDKALIAALGWRPGDRHTVRS